MASSSTSSIQQTFKYDVFLSFRGEDTRKNFIDHLYLALTQKGMITYKDDETIKKGKQINDELIKSIEDSKFYIIVFSKNYASSSWCLDELVKIMECQRMIEHTAYPIFYDVEPTEIRKQSGSIGVAFAKHEKEDNAGKWRDALQEAASLAGWELKNTTDGHEAKFIQKIVKEILLELRCTDLRFDGKLVGMETRVKDVFSSLETHIDDIRMIGIKGMGGGGKTTLARAVFDQIYMEFEGSSFIENVREVSNDSSRGLKSLQKQVLSDVLHDQGISVSGVFDGKNKLKRMLHCRKVLVVLDDVDHIDQLEALAGEPNWFKPGSRVIITTRDEQVLVAHRVNFIRGKASCFIHDVNLLSQDEAICLISRNAFGTESPIQGFKELSKAVVRYANGLPLTVSVLGSFLCNRSVFEWKDALERLKKIPLEETLQKLELSYNGLANDHKEIFLDVTCLLKGARALKSCGFHAEIGLKVLEQKSLITIDSYGLLCIHDHIEEMGKNIVSRLHPNEPYKRSRLWVKEEIEAILAKDQGTKATRCIYLVNTKLHATTIMKGIRKMKGLRFLYVEEEDSSHRNDDIFVENMEPYVLDALQYLHWDNYPLPGLPKSFQVDNVVQLQIRGSKIRQLFEGEERKVLDKLTYIDLSQSKELSTLDTGPTPNLETLILRHCYKLVQLYLQVPDKVTNINLSFCDNLRTLALEHTPNLETLTLANCSGLKELHMRGDNLKLKNIFLSSHYFHLKIIHLGLSPHLEELSLENCKSLEQLHMSVRLIKSLDFSFRDRLRTLDLSGTLNLEKLHILACENLVELHMPAELKSLSLKWSGVRTLDLAQIRNLEEIIISSCNDLVQVQMPTELRSICLGQCRLVWDLSQIRNLEEIDIKGNLVKLIMPLESLSSDP